MVSFCWEEKHLVFRNIGNGLVQIWTIRPPRRRSPSGESQAESSSAAVRFAFGRSFLWLKWGGVDWLVHLSLRSSLGRWEVLDSQNNPSLPLKRQPNEASDYQEVLLVEISSHQSCQTMVFGFRLPTTDFRKKEEPRPDTSSSHLASHSIHFVIFGCFWWILLDNHAIPKAFRSPIGIKEVSTIFPKALSPRWRRWFAPCEAPVAPGRGRQDGIRSIWRDPEVWPELLVPLLEMKCFWALSGFLDLPTERRGFWYTGFCYRCSILWNKHPLDLGQPSCAWVEHLYNNHLGAKWNVGWFDDHSNVCTEPPAKESRIHVWFEQGPFVQTDRPWRPCHRCLSDFWTLIGKSCRWLSMARGSSANWAVESQKALDRGLQV